MKLYRLKDPLFVLVSDNLDHFYLQQQQTPFETIACISYEKSNAMFIGKEFYEFWLTIFPSR